MAGALDDELLALAGSSEDEGSRPRANKRSPSHGTSSLAKKRRLDLLDESGSGSDADAPGSDDDAAPTRRARPRASSSDDDIADPYPYQGIYKSARDMEELMAMNELEREDILARRRDELNQRRQKSELAALVRAQQAAAGASKKAARKQETKSKRRVVRGGGGDSDSELSESEDEDADGDSDFAYSGAASAAKSRRKKMPGQTDAKSAKLSELRKRRKEKAAGTTSRVSDDEDKVRSRRGYASSSDDDSYASSDDDDLYSRRGKDTRRSRPDEGGSSEPPSLAELNAARISRERIEQRLYAPRWKDVLTGAFIRFAWRRAREDGQGTEEVYRIHQVTDVHEKPGKFYDLSDDRSGRWCNVYLAFEHAGEEREIRLSNLSRSPFIESERERWLVTLPAYKQKIPRASTVAAKADELEKFFDTPLTEADIKKVLEHKKKIRTQAASVMGSATPSTTDADGGKSLEARLAAVHERNRVKDRTRPDAKLKQKLAPSAAASGTATPTAPEQRQAAPPITNKFVTLPNFAATVNVDLGDF